MMMDEFVERLNNMSQEERLYTIKNLPGHLTNVGRVERLSHLLTDLHFIEAKCAEGMTYDLIADYNRLSVGSEPPIKTAWFYKNRYGIHCPFCLAWSEIKKNNLGNVIDCPACRNKLMINSFVIECEWSETGLQNKEAIEKTKEEDSFSIKIPETISEFANFVKGQAHILQHNPDLTSRGNKPA